MFFEVITTELAFRVVDMSRVLNISFNVWISGEDGQPPRGNRSNSVGSEILRGTGIAKLDTHSG